MFDQEKLSYYEVLDVKADATPQEIRQAYFRVKAAYSKDSAALYSIFDEQETKLVLERLEQAYLVLSSAEKRREYDKVHGYLSSDSITTTEKSSDNIFSFANNADRNTAIDAAHQAAATVLGAGSSHFIEEFPSSKPAAIEKPAAKGNPFDIFSDPSIEKSPSAFDRPAPRASSSPAANVSAFDERPYEAKMGIIKRQEVVRTEPESSNSGIDSLIASETQFRGDFFRQIREARGISLEQLADFTKISKSYLKAIENEEFSNLPAAVYVRGFVLQFAKTLKLPHDKAATAYMDHYKKTHIK